MECLQGFYSKETWGTWFNPMYPDFVDLHLTYFGKSQTGRYDMWERLCSFGVWVYRAGRTHRMYTRIMGFLLYFMLGTVQMSGRA